MPVGCAPTLKLVEEMLGGACELVTAAVLVNLGVVTFRNSDVPGAADDPRRTGISAKDLLAGVAKSSWDVLRRTRSLCFVAIRDLSLFALNGAWG
jgi:hypothetical protein